MTDFETPYPPGALFAHQQAGAQWAEEQAIKSHSEELRQKVKGLYLAGTVIWSAHRAQLLERFEAGGGVARVNQAKIFSGGTNYIELADGTHVYAKDILRTPAQVLGDRTLRTNAFNTSYRQTRTVSITFGGRSIGVGTARSDYELDTSALDLERLDKILENELAFPEIINLKEQLVTTKPAEDSDESDSFTENKDTLDYVLAAEIWGSNFMSEDPMPDPHTDYAAYKAWALRGNTHVSVQMGTPITNTRTGEIESRGTGGPVFDQYGSFKAPAVEVLNQFERFRNLLTFYAFQQYPDLFRGMDPETFDALPDVQPAIEA